MFILGWVGPVAVQCGSVRFSAVHAVHAVGCGSCGWAAVGCGCGFSITQKFFCIFFCKFFQVFFQNPKMRLLQPTTAVCFNI